MSTCETSRHQSSDISRQHWKLFIPGNDRNVLLKYIKKVADKERNGEDQYKCEICGKIGSRKDNVLNHVESTHFPDTFDYSCNICKKKMQTKKSLENHVYRNHKDGQAEVMVETQYVN